MFRVCIKTPTHKCCLSKMYPNAIIKHQVVFKGDRGVRAIIVVKTSKGENVKVVDEHKCELALCILESGAIVNSAVIFEKTIVWNLVCKNNETLKRVIENLEKIGVRYEIVYKTNLNKEKDRITYKEYLILRLAFEKGFFESPKKIRLDDLAKILGISKSTASETLRRGLKKAVMKYFESSM